MSTLRSITDEVLQVMQGFGLDQPRAGFLTSPATDSDTTLTLSDVTHFSPGIAEIGDELISIFRVDPASSTLELDPDGRGFYGTTPASYGINQRVTLSPMWTRQAVARAINDTITGVFPLLFGVGEHQLLTNPAQTTYEVPSDVEGIISVSADTFGPSREQQQVRRFSLMLGAPSDEWASGKAITLEEGVSPGQMLTVRYRKALTALPDASSELTESGLRETARLAVVYGACAHLAAMMDVSRLSVGTARADEYDEQNPVGTAAKISGQFLARHQIELEAERQRLRASEKVAVYLRRR